GAPFRRLREGRLPPLAGSDGDHLGWSGGARLPRSRAPLALSRSSGLAQARRAPLALDLSRARRIGNLAHLLLLARDLRRGAQTGRTLRGMERRSSIPHASLAPEGIRRVAPAGRLGRRDRPACETRSRAP